MGERSEKLRAVQSQMQATGAPGGMTRHAEPEEKDPREEPSVQAATEFLSVFLVAGIAALVVGVVLVARGEERTEGAVLIGAAVCDLFGATLLALARRAVIALVRIERAA
jgi:hypothetical protein